MQRQYGWKPDLPNPQDFKYKLANVSPSLETTSNRTKYIMPLKRDQLNEGSCTGQMGAFLTDFNILNGKIESKPKVSPVPVSPQFIYYNARVIEGTTAEDSGAQIRDAIKGINKCGACSEKSLPYNTSKYAKKPTATQYKKGLAYIASAYETIDNTRIENLIDCLQRGIPFGFGFSVFESFESEEVATTGIVPMPDLSAEKLLGGHAVVGIDWDKELDGIWCRNSWGPDWGDQSYFFLPKSYITNPQLADDFWVITSIK